MTRKKLIYLADLVHTSSLKKRLAPVPLNVGYLAAHVLKRWSQEVEVRLFVDPFQLLTAVEEMPPDILGLSCYAWNVNLSYEFVKHMKTSHPSTVTVMGGPHFPTDENDKIATFLRQRRGLDFYLFGEAEASFHQLVTVLMESEFRIHETKERKPQGSAYLIGDSRDLSVNGDLVVNRNKESIELDEIPSPYLVGVLDGFLAEPFLYPILETNRGCPYACTFCNWGSAINSKVRNFSMERLQEELHYITRKNHDGNGVLFVADANFGIFARDLDLACYIKRLADETGFPRIFRTNYAKNTTQRILDIGDVLKGMTEITLSMQSLSEDVLDNIKRRNIKLESYTELQNRLREKNVGSFVELIVGLPGETQASFMEGIKTLIRSKVDTINIYPAMLLPGAEMDMTKTREEFRFQTAFRFLDTCSGVYGPIWAAEYEEIVVGNSTWSFQDYCDSRIFSLLFLLIWELKTYQEIGLYLCKDERIIDLMNRMVRNLEAAPAMVQDFLRSFIEDARAELYQSEEQIQAMATRAKIEEIQQKKIRLNIVYLARLVSDKGLRKDFHEYLKAEVLFLKREVYHEPVSLEELGAILDYIDAKYVDFSAQEPTCSRSYPYDLKAWALREDPSHPLAEFREGGDISYTFTWPEENHRFFQKMVKTPRLEDQIYEYIVNQIYRKNSIFYRIDYSVAGHPLSSQTVA